MHQSTVELQHTNIRASIENEKFADMEQNVENMKKQRVWTENESTTHYVRISNNRIVVPWCPCGPVENNTRHDGQAIDRVIAFFISSLQPGASKGTSLAALRPFSYIAHVHSSAYTSAATSY